MSSKSFAAFVARTIDGVAYAVMGIVDLDAVPEDKRNLPFSDDTNPVPVVRFTNIGGGKAQGKAKKRRSRKGKSRARKEEKASMRVEPSVGRYRRVDCAESSAWSLDSRDDYGRAPNRMCGALAARPELEALITE